MQEALHALIERTAMSSLAAFALTLGVILLLTPIARRVGLVDRPGGRKTHLAATPVIGGAAMLAGSIPLAMTTFEITHNIVGLMAGGGIVITAGVLDDLFDLRWYWRFLAQTAASLAMIYLGGVRVEQIGPLFGAHAEALGFLSVPFTVLAAVGLMNALNMVDGIDGLAGALTAAALIMLTAAAVYAGNARLSHGLVLLLGALAAFLAFNLRTPWRPRASIFLGNAGSEFLGLVIAWSCFRLTQNHAHPVTPALAPFLLGVPVIDCLVLMVRRIRNGRSPFSADRNHFHHHLLDAGWSTTAAVTFMVAISFALGLGAALALLAHVQPIWLVASFAGLTLGYFLASSRRDRLVMALREIGATLGIAPPTPPAYARTPNELALEGTNARAALEPADRMRGRSGEPRRDGRA
jgi:UDP-GlcNAc:undecaprenyl-phosphate GlcNAc-1-phosphate transferase